jgi:hypothetical protein
MFGASLRDAARLLLRLGIRLPDALPQTAQGVGTRLGAETLVRAESLHNGLNNFFLNAVCASFAFPVIEHFGEPTDDRVVAVSVLMFETEEFA